MKHSGMCKLYIEVIFCIDGYICIAIIYIDELLVDHITQSLVAELAFPYWSLTIGESIIYIHLY